MAATAASAVLTAAKILYATVQQVKANKRQARLLAERVQAVVDPLRVFNDACLAQPEVQTALAQLLAVINDATTFVDDFGDMGRLKRTVFKTGHAERFAELNTRLSHAAQALTLGAVLQLHFQSADDLRAQTSDRVADKEVLGVWAIVPTLAQFVGRERELAELEVRLHPPASARSPATRIAISGMGGTGKSTLAQRSASMLADRFGSGWVVDGSNLASLRASLHQVASDLDLEIHNLDHIPRAVRARLGQPDCAGWLLIVDNVDDLSFAHELPTLLPNLGGCLVVTSRLAHWDRDEWSMISLAAMPASEGMQLLGGGVDAVTGAAAAQEVVAMLGGLPLALSQARTVVRRTRIGWSTYLERLQTQQTATLGNALVSLQVSLQVAIQEQPVCGVIFELLQALHADDIPRTILADALKRIAVAESDVDAALSLLADMSILHVTEKLVSVHRLMQEAMRAVRPIERNALVKLSEAVNSVVSIRAAGTMFPEPRTGTLLAVHYPVLLQVLETVAPGTLEYADTLLGYLQTDALVNAQPTSLLLVRKCLAEYDSLFEDGDVRKASAFFIVAIGLSYNDAHGLCGDIGTQLQLGREALPHLEAFFPTGHIEIARAHVCIGEAVSEASAGLALLEQGLAVFENFFGPDHVETARVRTRLARVHVKAGDAAAARSQLERALAAQEAFFTDGHGDLAQTLLTLADVHGMQGDADGDRACRARALALFDRHYGTDHALTLRLRAQLTPTPAPAPVAAAGPKASEQWTVAEVTTWLRDLDLEFAEDVVARFQAEGVRGRHLRTLTEDRLEKLGVPGGDRWTLLDELGTLSSRS